MCPCVCQKPLSQSGWRGVGGDGGRWWGCRLMVAVQRGTTPCLLSAKYTTHELRTCGRVAMCAYAPSCCVAVIPGCSASLSNPGRPTSAGSPQSVRDPPVSPLGLARTVVLCQSSGAGGVEKGSVLQRCFVPWRCRAADYYEPSQRPARAPVSSPSDAAGTYDMQANGGDRDTGRSRVVANVQCGGCDCCESYRRVRCVAASKRTEQ